MLFCRRRLHKLYHQEDNSRQKRTTTDFDPGETNDDGSLQERTFHSVQPPPPQRHFTTNPGACVHGVRPRSLFLTHQEVTTSSDTVQTGDVLRLQITPSTTTTIDTKMSIVCGDDDVTKSDSVIRCNNTTVGCSPSHGGAEGRRGSYFSSCSSNGTTDYMMIPSTGGQPPRVIDCVLRTPSSEHREHHKIRTPSQGRGGGNKTPVGKNGSDCGLGKMLLSTCGRHRRASGVASPSAATEFVPLDCRSGGCGDHGGSTPRSARCPYFIQSSDQTWNWTDVSLECDPDVVRNCALCQADVCLPRLSKLNSYDGGACDNRYWIFTNLSVFGRRGACSELRYIDSYCSSYMVQKGTWNVRMYIDCKVSSY